MMTSRSIRSSACLAVLAAGLLASAAAFAQVTVQDAWVRGTVPGQTSSGAFMTLQSADGAKVLGVSTPVAGTAEIHEMKMEGNVMRMRAVQSLELPKGQTVQLKPGGYHVMLMDLKRPLADGEAVPMTLRFVDAKGVASEQNVQLPVSAAAPGGEAMGGGEHQHKH